MRPQIKKLLGALPTRLWVFGLFLFGSIIQVAIQRAADHWFPMGTEMGRLATAIRWVADVTALVPPYALLMLAVGAIIPYLWDQRRSIIPFLRAKLALSATNPIDVLVSNTFELNDARQQRRRALIKEAREFVSRTLKSDDDGPSFEDRLQMESFFMTLWPHFSNHYTKDFNSDVITIMMGSNSEIPVAAHVFMEEIDRLEKEWGVQI